MGDVGHSPEFRAGWKRFERLLRDKLGSIPRSASATQPFEWERWIGDALEALEKHRASGYTYDIFETFRSVIVRIRLPSDYEGRLPRIHVLPRNIVVSGFPGKLDETIQLPAPVRATKPRAEYANGIVEVRLRKRTAEERGRRVLCSYSKKPPPGF